MDLIYKLFDASVIEALGWTLVHALWQGALLAITLGVLLIFMHRFTSNTRYIIAIIILGLMPLTSVFTYWQVYQPSVIPPEVIAVKPNDTSLGKQKDSPAEQIPIREMPQKEATTKNWAYWQQVFTGYIETHLPLLVTIWLVGVVVLLLRFLGGLAYLQRLKSHQTAKLADKWLELARRCQDKLQINKQVSYLGSKIARTPMAFGWLKPVVIIPVALLTRLSKQQVEAILVHELAHIKRHDFTVNVLQSLVDIVYFFHPAVWWLSGVVRQERENCCDDYAISIAGSTHHYAEALVQIAQAELESPKLAVAFTGRPFSFKHRIKRLMKQPSFFPDFREGFTTAIILVAGMTSLTFTHYVKGNVEESISSIQMDTFPGQSLDGSDETTNKPILYVAFDDITGEVKSSSIDEFIEADEEFGEEFEEDSFEEIRTFSTDETLNENLKLFLEAIDDGNIELVKYMIKNGVAINGQTDHGWSPLLEAVHEENEAITQLLLDAGANVGLADHKGRNAILIAAREGSLPIVELLVAKGANVNAKDNQGHTVLYYAIEGSNTALVSWLLDRGADVNAWHGRRTLFMEAVDEGNIEIVKLLLDRGANVNDATAEGYSALMEAADEGNKEMVALLINEGAQVNAVTKHGHTALTEAVDSGEKEVITYLLDKGAKVEMDNTHPSPLMEAIENGNIPLMKLLIENGADINKTNENGFTPLMEAVDEGEFGVVKFLVEELGVDVNAQAKEGWTALFEALDEGEEQIFSYLLEHGAQMTTLKNGTSLLHEAVDEGQLAMVKQLISMGADVNQVAHDHWTPLMEAIDEQHPQMISVLIASGAEVNVVFDNGWSPLLEACDEGNVQIVQMLLDNGAKYDLAGQGKTPLGEACDERNLPLVKFFLERGINPNEVSKDGVSPLMEAVDEGETAIVKLLVSKGADVNYAPDGGRTALFEAVDEGDEAMVQYLIDQGANVNAESGYNALNFINHGNIRTVNQSWTPLLVAIHEDEPGIIRQLVKAGAIVNQPFSKMVTEINQEETITNRYKGWTPLMEAIEQEHIDCVQALIQLGANKNATADDGLSCLDLAEQTGDRELISLFK